jgi:transcription antitermination factor NusG
MTSQVLNWFAVRVKSNRERNVAESLRGKGLEEFLPLYKTRRQWSDRVAEVHLPLFSGYVFSRFDPHNRLTVLQIPGVVSIVSCGRDLIPVEEREIQALRTIARAGVPAAPWPFLQAGQRVRVTYGALRDVEGLVTEVKNQHRLVVSVGLLQRSVAVEIDRDCVTPIHVPQHRLVASFATV